MGLVRGPEEIDLCNHKEDDRNGSGKGRRVPCANRWNQ